MDKLYNCFSFSKKLSKVLLCAICITLGVDSLAAANEAQSSSHSSESAQGQQNSGYVTIKGQVVDQDGETIIGAAVTLKGSDHVGTTTDADGKYSLKLHRANTNVLCFAYIGMEDLEVAITSSQTQLNVEMKPSSTEIDEIVVTSGYFNQNKATYTGSATTYKAENLRQISTSNMLTTLSMVDPTFNLTENISMGSNPNAMPEYTIRGGGSLESEYSNSPNQPTFIMDGFEVSTEKVFDLDPNRIASVTILKDASATAIYGSRAANGVVIIETIAPKEGELRVSYNFSGDLSVADLSDYNLMNSEEKLAYEAATGMYYAPNINALETLLETYNQRLGWVAQGISTDWIAKPINEFAFSQKHYIVVEGGDRSLRYALNANYNNTNGVMKDSGRNIVGVGAKLQYITGKLKFSNDLTYNNITALNSPYGDFSEYASMNPYYYPYNEDGSIKMLLSEEGEYTSSYLETVLNPLYNATIATKNMSNQGEFSDNFAVEWNPSDSFRFKGQLSLTKSHTTAEVFLPATHTSFYSSTEKGSYSMKETDKFSYDASGIASYSTSFGDHNLSINGVYNVQQTETDYYSVKATNFPNDNMDHIGMGTQYETDGSPSGDYLLTRMMGVALNANYAYDNRYMFDLSVRSDASSLFGANNRWGTFGSLGAAWNIHREKWFIDGDTVNELKLRASMGSVGGQNFYTYQALTMFSYNQPFVNDITYNDLIGAMVMAYGNDNLEWQRTIKRNIGLDFSLFKNRFSGCVDIYNDRSESVLIDVLLAPSTGFGSYTENLGEVENKGFELTLRYSLIKNNRTGLQVDIFGSAIHNKNQLLSMNDALVAFNEAAEDDEDRSTAPPVRYQVGESINTIWANKSLGIDSYTGEEVFLDLDGNRTNEWSSNNYMALGSEDPTLEGNFGTMVMYRGWQLNAYFTYSVGGDIYNQTLVNKVENVSPLDNADRRVLYDRWTTVGKPAIYKAIGDTSTTYPTSRFIERENYLYLSSVSLSYLLGKEALRKLGNIEQCKLTLSGNNLLQLSTVQMERGTSYPYANTVSLSAQITF